MNLTEITTTEIRPTSGQIPIDWFGVTMRLVITKKALFSCKKKKRNTNDIYLDLNLYFLILNASYI